MSIKLSLDTNALRMLLDLGGEEVRLQLTQAAIQNYADRTIRIKFDEKLPGVLASVADAAAKEYKSAIDDHLKDKFVVDGKWPGSRYVLTEIFAKQIRETARNEAMDTAIKAREEALAYVKQRIDEQSAKWQAWFDTVMAKQLQLTIEDEVKRRLKLVIDSIKS